VGIDLTNVRAHAQTRPSLALRASIVLQALYRIVTTLGTCMGLCLSMEGDKEEGHSISSPSSSH